LDQLAKEGILFTHNCVVTSICMQSRATLYTGQYSSVHQTFFSYRNVTMNQEDKWNQTLYPTMLRNGYHVGFFGKYHHLEPPKSIPTFSEFHSTRMSHYVQCRGVQKHVTQCNEDYGIQFLKKRPKDRPFFLTISFFATHAEDGNPERYRPMESSMSLYTDAPVPLPPTYSAELNYTALPPFFNHRNFGRGRFLGRYDTPDNYQYSMKQLYRMATEVDTACGNIIQQLKDDNVYENTLILFTTDNGNFHGQHGLAEKWYAYEESIRVPLIVKDPRMPPDKAGTENAEFTLNLDLAPTILSAAHIAPPYVMQGRDISTLYRQNNTSWRQEFFYEFWNDVDDIPNSVALVGRDFKYIHWTAPHNYTQYFDLQQDPLEDVNIFATTDPSVLQKTQSRLKELYMEVSAGRTL
jgi:arylsulfatase